jgi:hypothetical protein
MISADSAAAPTRAAEGWNMLKSTASPKSSTANFITGLRRQNRQPLSVTGLCRINPNDAVKHRASPCFKSISRNQSHLLQIIASKASNQPALNCFE